MWKCTWCCLRVCEGCAGDLDRAKDERGGLGVVLGRRMGGYKGDRRRD
jgi:hypothetical protein